MNTNIALDSLLWDSSSSEVPLPKTPPYLMENGVVVIYQQYEIAAYALGLPCVSLPLTAVKDCLTEEGKRYLGFK